jgi:hypothetical protein
MLGSNVSTTIDSMLSEPLASAFTFAWFTQVNLQAAMASALSSFTSLDHDAARYRPR